MSPDMLEKMKGHPMTLKIHPYAPDWVAGIRAGEPDAYGKPAERKTSDGSGNPCRHCLKMIPVGKEMLVVAARPFPEPQPYAETGPIFLCADECAAFEGAQMPECVKDGEDRLLKAYGADHRIAYGRGGIVAPEALLETCEEILGAPDIAFVDVRSSLNNCFTFRVSRAG